MSFNDMTKERSIGFKPTLAAANRANANPDSLQVKSQTRRLSGLNIINETPDKWKLRSLNFDDFLTDGKGAFAIFNDCHSVLKTTYCPYGVPGDLLYVKEEHYAFGSWKPTGTLTKNGADKYAFIPETKYPIRFNDNPPPNPGTSVDKSGKLNWFKRISLHMPKKYAVQWLMIKSIRVERLANISEADAIQEGIHAVVFRNGDVLYNDYNYPTGLRGFSTAKHSFKSLIQSIHGPTIWEQNPWVWVIEYMPMSYNGRPTDEAIRNAQIQIFEALQTQSI
jgi:hypothetical protein